LPMHSQRSRRKGIQNARPAAKPHPELSCLEDTTMPRALQLAPVPESKAKPAAEEGVDPEEELRGAPATAVAPKPRPRAAETTLRPDDRQAGTRPVSPSPAAPSRMPPGPIGSPVDDSGSRGTQRDTEAGAQPTRSRGRPCAPPPPSPQLAAGRSSPSASLGAASETGRGGCRCRRGGSGPPPRG
jgi:hypothetical protein